MELPSEQLDTQEQLEWRMEQIGSIIHSLDLRVTELKASETRRLEKLDKLRLFAMELEYHAKHLGLECESMRHYESIQQRLKLMELEDRDDGK